MVLGDVVAGIQLVKQSVAFIKDNINTCKDISEIAGSIDGLFEGKKQVDRKRNKKDGVSIAEQFGVTSVAKEIIDSKLAAEELYQVSVLINLRFGPNTWETILVERNKRIEEAKAARKEQIRVKRQQQAELMELAKYFFIGLVGIVFIVIAAVIYSIIARDDPLNLMR
jgi:hypothetical protein|tara:strand:+ start:392 stop:895 length:504 start_codon:yes stop_codon:yes gene_type:complete